MNTKRLNEEVRIASELVSVSSASTVFSKPVNMSGCDRALFVFTMGTAAANLQIPITIMEASAATACSSTNAAAVGGATAVIGSTAANMITDARQAIITISSASTDGNTVVINGSTFTVSTAAASTNTTQFLFGATAGATAANGVEAMVNSLTSRINLLLPNCTAVAASTAAVRIAVKDTAATSLDITGGANLVPSYESAITMIEVDVGSMDATSVHLCARMTSIATGVDVGVTVLTDPSKRPAAVQGYLVETT